MRYLLIGLTILVGALTPRWASAQFIATDDRPEFIVMSTSTTTAVAVGVIMLTVVSVKKDPTAMNRYLRQNEPAVRAAFAIGGGSVIDDLAGFFELDPARVGEFAALLRRHRKALCKAAYDDRDLVLFATLVQSALLEDATP